MAKNNRKKKKPQQAPLSPRKYIKEKARNFPIAHCYCNEDFQETGLAQIIVTRQQPSGKYIKGIFLVDIFCLGVKNTGSMMNQEEDEITETFEKLNEQSGYTMAEVDYQLVHSIIYGGLAYAADIGFSPNPDFMLAQYVLEPREAVELIPLEFGKDGRPFFVEGPYDNAKQIMAKLDAWNKR